MSIAVAQTQSSTPVPFHAPEGMEDRGSCWPGTGPCCSLVGSERRSSSRDGENTCTELGGEEEATGTPVETDPMIHFHSTQELAFELRIWSF